VWTVEEFDANDGSEPVDMMVRRDDGRMDFLEMAFLDAAFTLRATRADAFEHVWDIINDLNEDATTDGMEA
jgi:hypothetical protein